MAAAGLRFGELDDFDPYSSWATRWTSRICWAETHRTSEYFRWGNPHGSGFTDMIDYLAREHTTRSVFLGCSSRQP